jgi:hypothetical protein
MVLFVPGVVAGGPLSYGVAAARAGAAKWA